MRCAECQTSAPDGSRFCPSCGRPMAATDVTIAPGAVTILKWDLLYKGHPVMFQIHPIWGERLYIDDVLVDRGRPGVDITLRGTIEAGDGAGERITAKSRAGLFTLSCRIVVEAFSAAGR